MALGGGAADTHHGGGTGGLAVKVIHKDRLDARARELIAPPVQALASTAAGLSRCARPP